MMRVGILEKNGLSVGVVDGLFTDQEVKGIKEEILLLEDKALSPTECGSALDHDGLPKKRSKGVWVDGHFKGKRHESKILTANRKLFTKEVYEPLLVRNAFFGHLANSNFDGTLVNFYRKGDEYKAHHDNSVLTAITYFKIGEYAGGSLWFDAYGVELECLENRTIIFPGCVLHRASPITSETGMRIAMVQFLNYVDHDYEYN